MAEILQWKGLDDEDPYILLADDPLGVLSTTREVVEQGEYAWVNTEQVAALSKQWLLHEERTASPSWYDRYHFFDGTERTVNWLLMLDALNFCFWAEKGKARWHISYEGEKLNGYWAEAAALTRAVEEGMPLWDAKSLSQISSRKLTHIFHGTPGSPAIPLLKERLDHIREVGRVLLEEFDGQFANAIEQVNGNAVQLVLLLVEHFSSFRDVARYRNRTIRFFKRAQICVADIYGAFGGKQWGNLSHLDQLTIFADYKVPQVLRHLGVLEYHPSLAQRIDNQELIEAGSEEEVELRAATVWACELLRRALERAGRQMNAIEIDQRLWLLGQHMTEMRPYHRTRTIYY